MSEIYMLLLLLLSFVIVYCLQKIFNEDGLIYSIIILNALTYLSSLKTGLIFNASINISIGPMIGLFTAMYIYLYTKNDIVEIIKKICISNIIIIAIVAITSMFYPSITDNVAINIKEIFENNYLIIILYPFIIAVSVYVINILYKLLNKIQNNIILSILLTYIITSIIYTIIFNTIGHITIISFKESLMIGISTYIIGLIETIISIVFIKIITKKKVNK